MTGTLVASSLPLPLLRRGKVREVYEVDEGRLLLVASDRVSAFDVVMREAVPAKGAVLTQLSSFWFARFEGLVAHHCLTADAGTIVTAVPALAPHRAQLAGRAMLSRRTTPVAFECVVRGYLAGSAWGEYRKTGTLAGEPMPPGLVESSRLAEPLFSPATKAETGHDENVPYSRVVNDLGAVLANRLRDISLSIYGAGRDYAESRGIILADTKFEFGIDSDGTLRLIDEVLTPDSSRFWPADGYLPGRSQPSFDKQPLRDYLAGVRDAGKWNGEAPPPALPAEVVEATSRRYKEAYRRITGRELEIR
jgi:phosphoribosylaminoimidazole-succinocarboxamide synthase